MMPFYHSEVTYDSGILPVDCERQNAIGRIATRPMCSLRGKQL
jgi:hypothetical protein